MSALASVFIGVLLICASVNATEPTLQVDCVDTIVPGESLVLPFTVTNPTTYPCNNGIIYVNVTQMDETLRSSIDYVDEVHVLPHVLASGDSYSGSLVIELRPQAPDGTYIIPITFEGSMGTCEGGCFPFAITSNCQVTVKRKLPELHYNIEPLYDVVSESDISLPLTFLNKGEGDANNIRVSISGGIPCTLAPERFDELSHGVEGSTTLEMNTHGLDPGFYEMSFNVLYYDDYLRLYNEQVTFMMQVRPLRSLLTSSLLCENRCTLLEIQNEGGLKAVDVTYAIMYEGALIQRETIDEIKSTGSILAPVCFNESIFGTIKCILELEYFDVDGTEYFEEKEIFLNIPKNTSENNNIFYFIMAAALIVALAVVGRKRW